MRLTPTRFSMAVGEDAHEFQMTFPQRLYTLGLGELKGDDFNTYKLHRPAR